MRVCINYLVKPEKTPTFPGDLSRAVYLNFRMGRIFLFFSEKKLSVWMSSLGRNVNRISNWWFFCCCLTSSSIISIRHSQGEWQKLHRWITIVNFSESILASFCFVLHISIVFVCAYGSQQARHVTLVVSRLPTWKPRELNSWHQAWRRAFCTLGHLNSPWKVLL